MRELRTVVAQGCRILGANGQNDWVWGHVGARDRAGRGVGMKASGYGFEEITEERVLLVDRAGAVLDGDGRRHLEDPTPTEGLGPRRGLRVSPIYPEVVALRPDLAAVLLPHAEPCLVLGWSGQPVRRTPPCGSG